MSEQEEKRLFLKIPPTIMGPAGFEAYLNDMMRKTCSNMLREEYGRGYRAAMLHVALLFFIVSIVSMWVRK